ncbi:MAG: hypothetical protein J6J23_05045 [Clostridia bacterium]|nr:hypothetical protein [Clostridia bacterium]
MDIIYAGKNAFNYLISLLKSDYVNKKNIIDNCVSSNTDKPLSAKQGKALQDQITEIDETVDVATVDEVKTYLNI